MDKKHFVICKKCGSKHIFKFRLDSDWGYGSGDYNPVNVSYGEKHSDIYIDEELKYDACDRPDIEIFYCADCHSLFE